MGNVTCGHINRKNFSNGNCQECANRVYALRRQQRQREKRAQEGIKKINPETKLTNVLRRIYKILVAELLPRQNVCQGQGKITGCTGKPTEVHHAKGRLRYLLILSKYFRYLCRNCHDFCTENSAAARELGLSEQINSKTVWDFTDRERGLITSYGLSMPKDTT